MIVATALLSIVFFMFALNLFGVARIGNSLMGTVNGALETLFDKGINDETREKELQKASLKLFGVFFSIVFRFALIFLVSFLPIWIISLTGLVRMDDVIAFMSRWDVIIVVSAVMIIGYVVVTRVKSSREGASQSSYSPLDRFVHMIAFSDPKVQLMAANIEKKLFGKVYGVVDVRNPIFITSLPRAGTTLMLEVLSRFPTLATHTYRDMPFIMAPVLWERFSGPFRKTEQLAERAHGDGLQIGFDSPEAFEEILWRTFWPEKYSNTGIVLWDQSDQKQEARAFFVEHMKKIIALRRPDRKRDSRYISKNNGNIARLDLIGRMFQDARILVMVRDPFEHARSLLGQHRNFLKMHQEDPFVRRYMGDIGHYEFGDLHRPIAFPDTGKYLAGRDPMTDDYWLAYWIAAFEFISERRNNVTFISYEEMCLKGEDALVDLCARFKIPEEGMVGEIASIIKMPSPPKADQARFNADLRARARDLHKDLLGTGGNTGC